MQPESGIQIPAGSVLDDSEVYGHAQRFWNNQYNQAMDSMQGDDLAEYAKYLYGKVDAGQGVTDEERRLLYRSIPPMKPLIPLGNQQPQPQGAWTPDPNLTRDEILRRWSQVPSMKPLIPLTRANGTPYAAQPATAAPVASSSSPASATPAATGKGSGADIPYKPFVFKQGAPKPTFNRYVNGTYAHGGLNKDTNAPNYEDPIFASMSAKGRQMALEMNARGISTAAQAERDREMILRSGNKNDPFMQALERMHVQTDYSNYSKQQERLAYQAINEKENNMWKNYMTLAKGHMAGWADDWRRDNPRIQGKPGFDVSDADYDRMANEYAQKVANAWAEKQMPESERPDPRGFGFGFRAKGFEGRGYGDAMLKLNRFNNQKRDEKTQIQFSKDEAARRQAALRPYETDGFHGDMSD